jgi:uncharacterized membrane protein YraQ (UPF0718 family)
MFTLISVMAALIAGIAIGLVLAEFTHMRERIAALEAAQAKHLPYKTAESIEDAEAAIIKAMREVRFNNDLLENALAHMQSARDGNGKGR